MSRRQPIDMTHESAEVVRADYLDWLEHRCPKINRRGDRCISKTTEHGRRHDFGYWIQHHGYSV